MKSDRYDVVVIGAGPSGSVCARNLARLGYQVLLCEKRPVVGVPVRCGEATSTRKRLSEFIIVHDEWLETSIQGVILHGPGGVSVRYDAGKEIGVMLDRALFDQDLSRQAVAEGAELVCDARVSSLTAYADGAKPGRTLTVVHDGEEKTIHARFVVGADGAESLSGRWAGLKTRQLPPHTCSAIELRIEGEDPNPNHLTFWQGHDSVNKGYVWVFPKVKSRVLNLGSGELIPKLGAKNMYDLSMEYKQRLYPDAKLLEVHGGCVPVSGNLAEYTADGFLLCGDAAHHTNPLTGGGIIAGMVGADAASRWVHEALRSGNLSKAFLRGYEAECWNRFGRNHYREAKIRDFVVGLPREEQIRFYRIFKGMVDGGLKWPSKLVGYTKLIGLAARHWNLAKPVLQAGRHRPYSTGSTFAPKVTPSPAAPAATTQTSASTPSKAT